jgi:hypothetical protein
MDFNEETRQELLRVLNRIKTVPFPESASQMINVAEQTVDKLTAARKDEEESDTVGDLQIFHCETDARSL